MRTPDHRSTWLIQDELVGVKCGWNRGCLASQGAKGILSRTLTKKLRTGRPLRKQRRKADQRAARFAVPATLIDRRTRYVRLVALPDGHGADQVHARLTEGIRDVPDTARMTLTWDQGAEMACHDRLVPLFRDGVFVAHCGSPRQRGTNENTNGRLRQYLPKAATSQCTPPTTSRPSRTP
ncbi:IS30 family transposase [Streptomyces vinaceus]